MTFETFKELLIENLKNNNELREDKKRIAIATLKNNKKTFNDVNHNLGTEFALKLMHKHRITFDEYSKFYFELENYF